VLVQPDMGRALKEHVLEQVRESGSAGSLICGSDMIPEIHRHDGRGVVLG
jgi:hypothetical protein